MLGGVATGWFAQGPHRRDERAYRREAERLNREVDVLRRAPASPAADDLVKPWKAHHCPNERSSLIIKICGIKSEAILDAAIEAGADMVGFMHFARSPRHLELDDIGEMISLARGRAETCVVLVNPDNTLVAQVAALRPDWIQLHGPETPHPR